MTVREMRAWAKRNEWVIYESEGEDGYSRWATLCRPAEPNDPYASGIADGNDSQRYLKAAALRNLAAKITKIRDAK